MNVSEFFKEILEDGNVWVAMADNKAFVLGFQDDTSALPVWPNRENAVDFITNDETMDSLGPVEVPLSIFKRAWIAEGAMDFDELAIDPKANESKHLKRRETKSVVIWHSAGSWRMETLEEYRK